LQIQFYCTPFDPCDPGSTHGRYDRQVCEMYDSAAITRPRCVAKNTTSQDEAVKTWFVCETQADLRSLRDNASISEMGMVVIVTLQIIAPPLLQNVTVNGHFNQSGLHIETLHNLTQFVCCAQNGSTRQNRDETPLSSSSKHNSGSHKPNTAEAGIFLAGSFDVTPAEGKNSGSNQDRRSLCLFHVEDVRSMSSKTVSWWSLSTIVWLVLVLLVVVLVLLGVSDQVKNRCCCGQKKVMPVIPTANQSKMFSKRKVKSLGDLPDDVSAISIEDTELFLEKTPSDYSRGHATSLQRRISSSSSTKNFLRAFRESYNRGLSPIPELSVTDISLEESADEYDAESWSDDLIREE
ncbi:uncharacterized protein DAT39_012893, partial [Clarias magur]